MAKTLSVKVNAPEVLERQLSRRTKRGEYGIIALSTEPYMSVEEKLKATRILEKRYPELLPKYRRLYGGFYTPSRLYRRELEERVKRLCKKYGIRNGIV